MSQINTYYSDLLSEKDHNVNKRQFTHISLCIGVMLPMYVQSVCLHFHFKTEEKQFVYIVWFLE